MISSLVSRVSAALLLLGGVTLNWPQRGALLGGICGRSVVFANSTLYLISALSLLRALPGGTAPVVTWLVFVPLAVLAVVYGALLLRGPFDPLQHAVST